MVTTNARLPEGKSELTPREVADYLNVCDAYVEQLIEAGRLPAHTVDGCRLIAVEALARFDEVDRERRRLALDEVGRLDRELGL